MPDPLHVVSQPERARLLEAVCDLHSECVRFAQRIIRIATVNPPGNRYRECADAICTELEGLGFEVEPLEVARDDDWPSWADYDPSYERINVLAELPGGSVTQRRRALHLNGHFDVVPVGSGWTVDPFGAEIRGDRLFGRGSTDMKAGIAAAVFAALALERAGLERSRPIQVSATVDEESGGFAGVAELCRAGKLGADSVHSVIIPEPFGPSRICLGHRGVYWSQVRARGRIAHGSMPHLGVSAVEPMSVLLERIRTELSPALASRITAVPIVPEPSRRASINVNGIEGGQLGDSLQTPCVMHECTATLDRRFLQEEDSAAVRSELADLVEEVNGLDQDWQLELEDLMWVEPVSTDPGCELVRALSTAATEVTGSCELVASPGTYDHKHVRRAGGIMQCVAYGPGDLELAHQPDESCGLEALRKCTETLALTLLSLSRP